MKISRKSQYGLRAMVYLANTGKGFCSLREMSEKEEISFSYLEKICSTLEKANLMKSRKGAQGGYSLARLPKEIRVGDILRALEGKMVLVECVGSKGSCYREGRCESFYMWKKLQESIEKTIDSVTLQDLMKS